MADVNQRTGSYRGMQCEAMDKFGRLCLRFDTLREPVSGKWLCPNHVNQEKSSTDSIK